MLQRFAFLFALTTCFCGCAAYKLGSMLPDQIQTVHMSTVTNATGEPLIENEITNSILSQLQRDGSLTLTSEDRADALMYVRVYGYALSPLSYSRSNRSLPDEYRLTLTASVELVERSTGKSLVRSERVTGESEFPLSGDLTQAKRVGLPAAADDLARFVVAAVTEAWVE
jgi:hypothetical protein